MTATDQPSSLLATLGGDYYTDATIFAAEQERIFESMWFCAARTADMPNPGQFKKVQVGRESVLVVRGRDDILRAFLNVCRHRGAQLCTEAEGQARRNLRCPYHAWTYALDGKLVAAPNIATLTDETGAGIDRYRYGLVPVAITEWLGYAWVCLADEPPSFFDDVVGDVTQRLGNASAIDCYGIDGLQVGHRVVYDVAANWKLIVENFMECYHCASIHPELVEVLPEFSRGLAAQYYVGHGAEFGSDVAGFTVDGSAGFDALPGVTAEQDRRYYAITVKPTVFINLVPDHIIFHRMYPMAAGSHRRRMRLALRPGRGVDRTRRVAVGGTVPPGEPAGFRGMRANSAGDGIAGLPPRRCTRSCRTSHRGVPSVGSVPSRREVSGP